MDFTIFDEDFYLEFNPDVAAAVAAGDFSSGLDHFQRYGLQEGRPLVSPSFNERTYLENYPDVAAAVTAGDFSSGLDHYIRFGEAEGRSGIPFNEEAYLTLNPDVAAAVTAGDFSSGLDHYEQFGQSELRSVVFSGTDGNDVVTGFGQADLIFGVNFSINTATSNIDLSPGTGEFDILTGGEGFDSFYLGTDQSASSNTSVQLYVGGGNGDYALIRNFDTSVEDGATGELLGIDAPGDVVFLAGAPSDYTLEPRDGDLHISTTSGDLVGIVQGVTSLEVVRADPNAGGTFFLG